MHAPRTATAALALCLCLSVPATAALYVTDQLEITLRSGAGLDYKILRMLPSGTSLETLEDKEGWSRVRTPKGDEGWVITRYLTSEPPKGPRLEAALRELEAQRAETARQKTELEAARADRDRNGAEARQLQGRLEAVEKELQSWKRVNADVMALKERAETLQVSQEGSQAEMDRLRTDNQSLKARETFYWFFSGVVVLLLGWVLGYVYASSRQKAKASSRFRF